MLGKLYMVALPIGNLGDITLRALEVLKNVDFILAEDTRVTSKLLRHYNIEKSTLIYNQRTFRNKNKLDKILNYLLEGKNIALVTDAGTPGISDPGNELIDFIYSHTGFGVGLDFSCDIEIIPIPGPSAVSTALSVCGFDTSRYIFIGFFPKKKKLGLIRQLEISNLPVVYFDSPRRLIKNLEFIRNKLGDRKVFIGRELTKIHETHYRGALLKVIEKLKKERLRGEMVIVVDKN